MQCLTHATVPSPEFQAALIREWTWKTPAMRDMTLAVCRLALTRSEFSALDLPLRGAEDQGGTCIAGSIFRQLADAGLIARCGVYVDGKFYPKTVTNAGGNPIGVYTVKQPSLARALIRAHAPATLGAVKQTELVLV